MVKDKGHSLQKNQYFFSGKHGTEWKKDGEGGGRRQGETKSKIPIGGGSNQVKKATTNNFNSNQG